ncbi:hypothetical protein BDZ94DRAFT_1255329 [Collybia nuda]|uniref:C2H2-type domain-containing protein n=1 Tax=Collybia nuda TaxID=64659 RepID=A0A9P5Y9V8_9AGAR|nr:hypothetical protein BDZ94DRAFT_1255329 [Collybia nuda]
MFYHIRSHALIPLECAYKDCQESFRTPQQLVRHHEAVHRNDPLKPSAALFTPELSPLPAAPEKLPAYMVEARQVQPPSISKDRHNTLGPWVGTKRYQFISHPAE